jgi:hypothetical protein
VRRAERFLLTLLVPAVLGFTLLYSGCGERPASETEALDIQIRLFEALAAGNPNYHDTAAALSRLDPVERERHLEALALQNAENPRIAALLDSLLSCAAYQLYYRQFPYVTPEVHRDVLVALPYRAIPSPADIGRVQLELFQNRDSLPALAALLRRVDKAKAVAIANRWSLTAGRFVPVTHYILDGNADAFARNGEVCFDLFGVLLGTRPESSRYTGLGAIPVSDIEAVLAHEYQHAFAQPYLYPAGRKSGTWQARWADDLITRIVSEGLAMQCNPPSGFKKAVFEDSLVVRYWVRELQGVLSRLRHRAIPEDAARIWLDQSYQVSARRLLADFLARTYPEADQASLLRDHLVDRPSAVYTLGWWMIGCIVASPDGPGGAVALLAKPSRLLEWYNAVVPDTSLRIDVQAGTDE